MSLYIPKKEATLDENLNITFYPSLAKHVFFLEDAKYLLCKNGYLSYKDENFYLDMEKSNAQELKITDGFKVLINGSYLNYHNNKLSLSFGGDYVLFAKDLEKIYIHNRIGFIHKKFDSDYFYTSEIHDFLVDNNAILTGEIEIDLENKEIKNVILIDNKDLHQIISIQGNYFEWWFESLTTANHHPVFPHTFSKIKNNETLDIVYKCKDVLLLEQLLTGLRDPLFVNDKGESALMIAIKEGLTNTVNYLLETGINLVHFSQEGLSALDYAIIYKNFNAVQYLSESSGIKTLKRAVESNNYEIIYQIFSQFTKNKRSIPQDILEYVLENSPPVIANLFIRYDENIQDIYNYLGVDSSNYDFEEDLIDLIGEITDELILICVFTNYNKLLKHIIDKGTNMNLNVRGYGIERFVSDPSLIVKIIESKTGLRIEKEIPLYLEKNFRLIKEVSEGSFGTVTLELNNIDQKEYIIKKSKICENQDKYDETLVKEIFLMQKINETFPDLTSKLYGVMLSKHGDCVSLVLENSGISAENYINTIPKEERVSKFKQFFKPLLEKLQNLHSLGVSHDDLHIRNILVKDDIPVIIDYGFFNFYEIFPYKDNLSIDSQRPWIPPDKTNVSNEINYYYNFFSDYIKYKDLGYKTYNSDVFAVGQLMCYYLFENWIHTSFFSFNGKIINHSVNKFRYFTDLVPKDILPLLVGMLDLHSEKRFSVTEALNHEYFTGQIVETNYVKHGLKLNLKGYQVTEKVDMYLIERMFQTYKNCSVKVNTIVQKSQRLPPVKTSLNAAYNYTFLQLENIEQYSSYQTPLILSTSFFDYFNQTSSQKNINREVLNELVNKKLDFKPVTLFFFYIILKYRVEKINNQESFDFLIINFERFLLNVDFDFNIWNVISVIFWNATNSDSEIGNLDISNPEKIIALIS